MKLTDQYCDRNLIKHANVHMSHLNK